MYVASSAPQLRRYLLFSTQGPAKRDSTTSSGKIQPFHLNFECNFQLRAFTGICTFSPKIQAECMSNPFLFNPLHNPYCILPISSTKSPLNQTSTSAKHKNHPKHQNKKQKQKQKKNYRVLSFVSSPLKPNNKQAKNRGNSHQLHQPTKINSSQKSLIIMLLVVSIYRIHLSLLYHSLPFRGGFFPFPQLISLHYHSPLFLSRHLLFTCLPLPFFHPL